MIDVIDMLGQLALFAGMSDELLGDIARRHERVTLAAPCPPLLWPASARQASPLGPRVGVAG